MKGEKRPRLPKREVQDMASTTKVQTARRMEVFSSAVRPARKSVMAEMYSACDALEVSEEKNCSMAALYRGGRRVVRLNRVGDATVGNWQVQSWVG